MNVQTVEGSGTELVSVYIPPETDLQSMIGRISQEIADAENIKSKETRQNVQDALDRVHSILQEYRDTPENGLVVFAGNTGDEIQSFVYDDLPIPIESKRYVCDNEFYTEDLEELYLPDEEYGIVTVTRDSGSVGRYRGSLRDTTEVNSHVMGKSKAGGQSQARFERLRAEQKENHYKKLASVVHEYFDRETEIVLGGTNVSRAEFQDHIPHPILGEYSIEYAGSEESLDTLVSKASTAIEEAETREARESMEQFLERLRDDDRVTYGSAEVERAISLGAVDKLLLSTKTDRETRTELSEECEQMGGTVYTLSRSTEVGQQLSDVFGGYAALLRFDV